MKHHRVTFTSLYHFRTFKTLPLLPRLNGDVYFIYKISWWCLCYAEYTLIGGVLNLKVRTVWNIGECNIKGSKGFTWVNCFKTNKKTHSLTEGQSHLVLWAIDVDVWMCDIFLLFSHYKRKSTRLAHVWERHIKPYSYECKYMYYLIMVVLCTELNIRNLRVPVLLLW